PQHHAVRPAERTAAVMCGLVQVRHACIDTELRPECVDHTIAWQPVTRRERKELHEIACPTMRPSGSGYRHSVHHHLEPTEEQNPDALHFVDHHTAPEIDARRSADQAPQPRTSATCSRGASRGRKHPGESAAAPRCSEEPRKLRKFEDSGL